MSLISKFNESPADFPDDKLEALASEVRARIIGVVARNGGHLASSLGAVELIIALLKVFDPVRDKIVWDVGHQTYAWKILTGRDDRFDSLRTYGGISGFPRRDESPCDAFGAGHAGSAISAALGLAAARDCAEGDESRASVVAVTGDASISNGVSLEALNNVVSATKRFILVLNDNEMAISKNVGALSRHFGRLLSSRRYNRLKTGVETFAKRIHLHWLSNCYHRIESTIKSFFVRNVVFEDLGLRYVGPLDGHNITRLVRALAIARDYNRPIILHVATQKGRGYAPAEANPADWHGVGPFEISSGRKLGKKTRDYSAAFGDLLAEAAERDGRVVAITAAMPSGTGLESFAKRHPGRFFDVGICEEHAVTFAAGLAAGGRRPFVALYSTFAQRAVDCVFHDVCLQKLPVTLCLDRAGVVGADGMTHHGLFDIPMLRPLPGLVIAQPRDEQMFRDLIVLSLASDLPFALRYPRGECPANLFGKGPKPTPGKAEVVRDPCGNIKRHIWIWALGDMLPTAIKVADALEATGAASVGVVDPVFIKPLDAALLASQIACGAEIATFENGTLQGGFGSAILEAAPHGAYIRRFGFGDAAVPHGKPAELLECAGLDVGSLVSALGKPMSALPGDRES